MQYVFHFHISTFCGMCAMPNMVAFRYYFNFVFSFYVAQVYITIIIFVFVVVVVVVVCESKKRPAAMNVCI